MKLGTAGKERAITPVTTKRRSTRGFNGGDVLFFILFFYKKKAFIQVQKDAWLKGRALCIKNSVYFVSRCPTRRRPLCNPDRSFRQVNPFSHRPSSRGRLEVDVSCAKSILLARNDSGCPDPGDIFSGLRYSRAIVFSRGTGNSDAQWTPGALGILILAAEGSGPRYKSGRRGTTNDGILFTRRADTTPITSSVCRPPPPTPPAPSFLL